MAKKRDDFLEQAQAQSLVRFGPEMSALRALLAQATQSYEDRVRNAKAARQFTTGAVDAAGPRVEQAYRGAKDAVTPAFAAQGGVEAGALNARLGEAQALAQSQLAAQRVSAIEGQTAQVAQALRDREREQGKIGDRGLDLIREMGAFTTATAGELSSADAAATAEADRAAATLNQQERNSIRSSGFDPDTGLPLPGGKADPKAKTEPWATAAAQGEAADEFDKLHGFAAKLKAQGVSRKDAAAALLVGRDEDEVPVYETVPNTSGQGTKQVRVLWKKGDKIDGKPIDPSLIGTQKTRKVSAVPQAKSKLLLTAALDQAYDTHLSRRTQKLLHQRRIKIKPLGATTFGEWLQTPEGQEWQRKRRSGRSGNASGNVRVVGQGGRPGIGHA